MSRRLATVLATFATFASLGVVASAASCATNEDAPLTAVDSATPLPAADAAATDGALADAPCDGPGCGPAPCTTAWCPVDAPVDDRYALRAVKGSSRTDVWAVGSGGSILHYDGTSWVTVPSGTTRTLSAVDVTAGEVWIAGTSATILRAPGFAGAATTLTNLPIAPYDPPRLPDDSPLVAAWVRNAADIWVAGTCFAAAKQPTAERWRTAGSPTDGGAASWKAAAGGCSSSPGPSTNGLWGIGAEAWAVANNGAALHAVSVDGPGAVVWTSIESQTDRDLHGVWGSAASDVWMVGRRGTARHYDGSALLAFTTVPTTEDLHAVWGSSRTDVWAVGDAGTILHFDGTAWTADTASFPHGGQPNLYGVWGSAANDVWIVGEAVVLHFEGGAK